MSGLCRKYREKVSVLKNMLACKSREAMPLTICRIFVKIGLVVEAHKPDRERQIDSASHPDRLSLLELHWTSAAYNEEINSQQQCEKWCHKL